MSKKMWNRIFKTKSSNKNTGISKKSSIPTPPTTIAAENRLSYYEEFHNCCQQQQPAKTKSTCRKQAVLDANGSPAKTPSKFSKVVNTFTLKRNSKENQSNQLNTNATALDTTTSSNHRNENNNYSLAESVVDPIMDKIATPTAAKLPQADNTIETSEEPVSLELIPCPTCTRTFVPKTLEKHMPICEKMAVRRRKVFDSSRQRREGTELASYSLPKNFGLPPPKPERVQSPRPTQATPPPILSPKKAPEEVVRTPTPLAKPATPMLAKKLKSPLTTPGNAMGSQSIVSPSAPKERIRAAAAPKRIQPPPAEPCPYCERCFGVKAYDRHVEWCKEKALIASMKQHNTNTQAAAKERLEARTKYRAPCLKTKRSLNRDKYSCQNDENGDMHTSMMEEHHSYPKPPPSSIMSCSMTSSIMSDGSTSKLRHPIKKTQLPTGKRAQLMPLESVKNKKRSVVDGKSSKLIKDTFARNGAEALRSTSIKTFTDDEAAVQMSDEDLEQLYKMEFQNNIILDATKMHADTQATKLKSSKSKQTKKPETPFMSPETSPIHENAHNERRRLIKERIEFFNSSSSVSSNASCQTSAVSAEQVPGCLPKNKSFVLSGLSDNYDPFLSAKRQLEELCSPSSPTDTTQFATPNQSEKSKTPTKQITPTIPDKMTTSLTSTTSLTNPRRALTTVKSNFRRTSSLRAPRRSPLPMPSRPIFFPTSQKQRPTIQRGLSDEGPISTNFLKPEEYDEMPVRSVCVNDFAISNTPKVIRRDSNAAINRKNLRLQIPGAGQRSKENSPTPPIGIANSTLSKTDSLAVFLKYENEAKVVENPVINTKELKDKSNTLSKQNSAKSVISTDEQQGSTSRPIDIPSKGDHSNSIGSNLNCIKLEPIVRPMTMKQTASPQLPIKRMPQTVKSPTETKSVNLNLIFETRDRDRLPTSDADYIDPKLINICDNLDLRKDLPLSSNTSSSASSTGGDCIERVSEKTDAAESNIPLQSSSSSNSSPSLQTFKKASSPAPQSKSTPVTNSCSNSNRSSGGDNRNLLKRKMRPGRNQFLYDASPENETHDNDADDEGNHHLQSCDLDIRKLHQQHTTFFSQNTSNIGTTSITNMTPPFSPSTFDEFDFEEFLSSFDNDDDKFPSLFKDCREFLMNRSTLNKRSNIDKLSSYRSTTEVLNNSGRKYQQDMEQNLNSLDNKKCVTANPTAQVEEVDANDNKFRKIEDDENDDDDDNGNEEEMDAGGDRDRNHNHDNKRVHHHEIRLVGGDGRRDEEDDDRLRMRRINLLNDFPNVRLNNAKNLIQQMHEDFRDLHATTVATTTDAEDMMNGNTVRQITESSLYPVDSDEISSIECYPVRINRSSADGGGSSGGRNGVQSKHSADSAYGSLSRQSPTSDINSYHRDSQLSNRTRTATPHESPRESPYQTPKSPPYKYTNLNKNDPEKHRYRNFSVGSSSSGSDNSLPPIGNIKSINKIHDEYQSPRLKEFHHPFHHNQHLNSNQENKIIHTQSPKMMATNNLDPSPSTPTISPTSKMSKFCHECGSKFLLEQAKFCMDCGVRRIILK